MCGRYSRGQKDLFYLEPLMSDADDPRFRERAEMFRPSWNVSPGTKQPILKPDGPHLEVWGFRPPWAVARKVPMMVNARLDKASTSTWKALFRSGRCLVPADGWYEWLAVGKRKQPYFIQSNDGPPIFFAGLSSVKPETPDAPPTEHSGVVDGFVIVTDAAAGGMLDVHDRRPLVLTVEEARVWLDPDTTFEEAVHVANNARKVSEDFHWFPVTPNVNKSGGGNDSPVFNEPIAGDEPASNCAPC
ncbi:SOS response-associated peptidase [Paraburkholderia sp.]|uniref:SOS response-associated peptidase n=1 Tax=Paraburkholderia sp. TaxID=1926495 RepID=UPI003C7E999E